MIQFHAEPVCDPIKRLDPLSRREVACPLVAIAADHAQSYPSLPVTSSVNYRATRAVSRRPRKSDAISPPDRLARTHDERADLVPFDFRCINGFRVFSQCKSANCGTV